MTPVHEQTDSPPIVGILAEFDGPEALKTAAAGLRAAGYARYEAFSPYPVHGLYEVMGRKRTVLPRLVLAGGIAGCLGALLVAVVDQRGRLSLLDQRQAAVQPAGEHSHHVRVDHSVRGLGGVRRRVGVLQSAGTVSSAVWVRKFRQSTTDAFFLAVEAADPQFDETGTADLLRSLGAARCGSLSPACTPSATFRAL